MTTRANHFAIDHENKQLKAEQILLLKAEQILWLYYLQYDYPILQTVELAPIPKCEPMPMTPEQMQEDFWHTFGMQEDFMPHDMGEMWGYDIIGSETHPLKEVFEVHCKIRKLDFDEESDEESEEEEEDY